MIVSPLDDIILAADAENCLLFCQSLNESQRKTHSARALQWASAINGYMCRGKQQFLIFDKSMAKDFEFYQSIQSGKVAFPASDFSEGSFPVAKMAVLATCGFPELKKAGRLGLPEPTLAVRVLQARKPSWLDKWCAYVIKEFFGTHWLAVHELEKSGLCQVERTAGYWMSMLCCLPTIEDMYDNILRREEDVRNELWDMLADPGVARMLAEPELISHEIFRKTWNRGGNIFAPKPTGSRRGSQLWQQALLKLADDGLIDRQRLIEYSFTTLSATAEKEAKKSVYHGVSTADFAVKLNQELTKNNSASYAGRFASLLGAAHKDVSTYASTVLLAMPEGTLSSAEICSCIAPAFLNKSKEPAEAALKLLNRLAKEHPGARSEYGPAILSAFHHSSKDIHKKALALIESTKMLEDSNLLSEFSQCMDMLAGMERTKAAQLAAQYQGPYRISPGRAEDISQGSVRDISQGSAKGSPEGGSGCVEMGSPDAAGDNTAVSSEIASFDELQARSKTIAPSLRELARIDEAIETARNKMRLDASVSLDTLEFPRLNPDAVVKPIVDLDDLVYMFAKVWSGKSDSMDLEAVLDGVSRLCHERPLDFEQKTDALRQKAQKIAQDPAMNLSAGSLGHLVLCWLGGSNGPGVAGSAPRSFFGRRCLALSRRVASRRSAPLLAAPTHAGGWIDPEILVKRIIEYFWLKIEPDTVDFIQALLRVAPDNRASALAAAAAVKGEIGEALRFALGGGNMARIQTPEYWVAAFRARDPQGTSNELLQRLPHFPPDGAEPARYGFDLEPIAHFGDDRYASISAGLPNFLPVASADPDFPGSAQQNADRSAWGHIARSNNRNKYALFPTVLLHDNSNSWISGPDSYNWLHNRESLLALYAKRMLQNIESVGNYWQSDYELLFDPDVSMARNGRYFLCFAMSSKNSDVARLAVDVLIAAVAECRIGAADFGEAMAAVLPSGVITAVRWVRGFRAMARISPLHAHFSWQAFAALLEQAAITSTQKIPYLELLAELQVEHRYKTDRKLEETLTAIAGEGKAGKLAKTILAFGGEDNSTVNAALQDLESRISRAERWQAWSRTGKIEAVV